jgi:hypothetical protein
MPQMLPLQVLLTFLCGQSDKSLPPKHPCIL